MTGVGAYQARIGLEIHVQLLTNTKVFCSCRNAFGDRPNENVCPICLGYPGVLPALNREALLKAYVLARSLDCQIGALTAFERKNYFYPDLPKNYQISQYGAPIGRNGRFCAEIDGNREIVGVREVHLEEDAGKMIHAGDMSLLDFNRTGTPLVEVVTLPHLTTAVAAEQFLEAFRNLVRFLKICDGNMEHGSIRCDANVSVNQPGERLGNKVEIKNLNSFKFLRNALAFEIQRQSTLRSSGKDVTVETRQWNENRDCTEPMRIKESEDDYRYFLEPDLPLFRPDKEFLTAVETRLVEQPLVRRDRIEKQYSLSPTQAAFLVADPGTVDFFEQTIAEGCDASLTARWLGSDVRKHLNQRRETIEDCTLTPSRFAALMKMVSTEKVSGKIAKNVLATMIMEDCDPQAVIEKNDLQQVTDIALLKHLLEKILEEHPLVNRQIEDGERKPVGFLVGQVMRHTDSRAHPATVHKLIESLYVQRASSKSD